MGYNINELYNLLNGYIYLREEIIKECMRNELIENDDIDTSIINENNIREKCIISYKLQNTDDILEIQNRIKEMKNNLSLFENEGQIADANELLRKAISRYRDLLFSNTRNVNAYELCIDTINTWFHILK